MVKVEGHEIRETRRDEMRWDDIKEMRRDEMREKKLGETRECCL